ncbi:MAG TPA: hypothetical protein VIL00_04960 [Pseudonocardiaceae bacterium]
MAVASGNVLLTDLVLTLAALTAVVLLVRALLRWLRKPYLVWRCRRTTAQLRARLENAARQSGHSRPVVPDTGNPRPVPVRIEIRDRAAS